MCSVHRNFTKIIHRVQRNSAYWQGVLTGAVTGLVLVCLCYIYKSATNASDIFQPYPFTNRSVPPGPRVLCVISTYPFNYLRAAVHVEATWAGRCDLSVYLSSTHRRILEPAPREEDVGLRILEVEAGDRREDLWPKVKLGLTRIWSEYAGEFDYLLKADDDTYVVMENLKHALNMLNASEKVLFGHRQESDGMVYMSGGSGYVLSAAGVKDIVENGLSGEAPCTFPHPYGHQKVSMDEDLQMGACAELLGFKLVSSDLVDGSTFLPFKLETHLVPQLALSWYKEHRQECSDKDICTSTNPISFHYVSPRQMYVLDYLLYKASVRTTIS